jgi:hypothetical protein
MPYEFSQKLMALMESFGLADSFQREIMFVYYIKNCTKFRFFFSETSPDGWILGVFANLRETPVKVVTSASPSVFSLCLSARNSVAPTGCISEKFYIWYFYGNLSRRSKFCSRIGFFFLAKHHITQVCQPPYSPDLAPCDFRLFPKLKSLLKGRRFVNEVTQYTSSVNGVSLPTD